MITTKAFSTMFHDGLEHQYKKNTGVNVNDVDDEEDDN